MSYFYHLLRVIYSFIFPPQCVVPPWFFVLAFLYTQTNSKTPEALNYTEREEDKRKYQRNRERRTKRRREGGAADTLLLSIAAGWERFNRLRAQSPTTFHITQAHIFLSLPVVLIPPLSPLAEVTNLSLREIKRETEGLRKAFSE